MWLKRVIELIKLLKDYNLEELETRNWFRSIKIVRRARIKRTVVPVQAQKTENQTYPTWHNQTEKKEESDKGFLVITSPMVGTFYRVESSEAGPLVKIGDRVEADKTVVCIIEAMKLMNPIESKVTGTIIKVLVENKKPVDFGMPLFKVKPD